MATRSARSDEVRDFSIGRVFERASAAVMHNPVVTLSAALLLGAIPTLLLTLLFSEVLGGNGQNASANMSLGLAATGIVTWLAMMAVGVLVQAALTRATVAESEGRRAGFGESMMAGLPVLLPLIGLILLWTIGVALGMMLLIVPGIILLLMWSVAIPAMVEERQGVFAAFARSRALTSGSRWKILGVLVILIAAYLLLVGVLGIAGISSIDISGTATEAEDVSVVAMLGNLISSMLFSLVWGTVQAAIYVELRDAKESGNADSLHEVFA
ncbi:MAG: YciC family protein [Pseudomonadota bacterium]